MCQPLSISRVVVSLDVTRHAPQIFWRFGGAQHAHEPPSVYRTSQALPISSPEIVLTRYRRTYGVGGAGRSPSFAGRLGSAPTPILTPTILARATSPAFF